MSPTRSVVKETELTVALAPAPEPKASNILKLRGRGRKDPCEKTPPITAALEIAAV